MRGACAVLALVVWLCWRWLSGVQIRSLLGGACAVLAPSQGDGADPKRTAGSGFRVQGSGSKPQGSG